jgi:two-component system, NtrC family, sensor kinase
MQPFVWNQRFATGLEMVDQQHRRLVDLVNRVGTALVTGIADESAVSAILTELADYARRHFADEERLMTEHGVDRRHVEQHKRHHQQFIQQVLGMWQTRTVLDRPFAVLEGFLSSWLSFHILEEDHAMARQIALITKGTSPAEAFHLEQHPADNATAVLLAAMNKLYHVLSLQNQGLADANVRLEEKVADRTRELLQSEKMAAVGQLAAGVAHEINNPVGFVNSNLGTLGRYATQLLKLVDAYAECQSLNGIESARLGAVKAETDLAYMREDLVALIQESQDGLDRVKKIVQDLKDFSHASDAEWQQTDLNAGLESTINVVWNELKYKAEVKRELGKIPWIRCIPGQINQVFMNLLVNAAQAIPERGTITVSSGTEGDGVWVEVADSGSGMTPEVQKRIFEPFYTTKPVGKGTGLGLSLSWDIVVNKHGGRFDVESTPGRGTSFRIWLPAKEN